MPHNPGYIKTPADAEARPLTEDEAQQAFTTLAAKGDEIAFRYVRGRRRQRSRGRSPHAALREGRRRAAPSVGHGDQRAPRDRVPRASARPCSNMRTTTPRR